MLLTKLHIPPPGKNYVRRLRFLEKLDQGLNRKLILVAAPAGFGKTTLISDWINHSKTVAVWISLDSADNEPAQFLQYIIAGFRKINEEFGSLASELLNSQDQSNFTLITGLLTNEMLALKQDILLVLDDFHLIQNREVLDIITNLLKYMPGNMHLAIITRSDPTLNLARLRSQQQLVDLRASDLCFSIDEISNLFNKKLKLNLSKKDLQRLEAKTEGWIAGLQLAALSIMQGKENTPAFIEAFAGNNRYIMDYLIEEVLKNQSGEIQDFLLKTAVLKQFSAPLCDAILKRSDSQEILEYLERNNMFIFPLDEERHWYRYHHLFADLLKQRFISRSNHEVHEVHSLACEWWEQNKMYGMAIDHALEINDRQMAINLLNQEAANMWANGQHLAILKYGQMMPEQLIVKAPDFCLYYSWILIASGQTDQAKVYLKAAEKIVESSLEKQTLTDLQKQHHKKMLGKIAVAFAYLYSHGSESDEIFDYCKMAMENLTEEDPFWISWAWFSYGVAYFSVGKLKESKIAFHKAFELSKKSGNLFQITTIAIRMAENEQQFGNYKSAYEKCTELLGLMEKKGYAHIAKTDWRFASLYFIMASTHFSWAEFDKAQEYIKIAYQLSKQEKDSYLRVFVLMLYSYVLKSYGHEAADSLIDELEDLKSQIQMPVFLESMYIGWKISILILQNQIAKANQIAEEYGLSLETEKTEMNDSAYIAYARLLIEQFRLTETAELLSELTELALEGKRIERQIEIQKLYAFLYKKQGHQEKAINSLIKGMELAAGESLLSYFVFDTDYIKDLYPDVLKTLSTRKTKVSKGFIEQFKSALEKEKSRSGSDEHFSLSKRELDTLKLMAEDYSNQEIANQLFISINTVKTHVRNILLKFEVEKRGQAVAKARKFGVL